MSDDREQFERCWPWLCGAVERYGHTHEKEDVWKTIERKDVRLHPLPNSAIATVIQDHPAGMRECVAWLAGGDLREIVAAEPLVARVMKELGCHRVSIRGRRGWGRVFTDYHEVGTILVKELQ